MLADPFTPPERGLVDPLQREDDDFLPGEAEGPQLVDHGREGCGLIFRLLVIVNTDPQAGQGIGGLEVEGQVLAHEASNAVGRAVVLTKVQAREPRQGQGRLVE